MSNINLGRFFFFKVLESIFEYDFVHDYYYYHKSKNEINKMMSERYFEDEKLFIKKENTGLSKYLDIVKNIFTSNNKIQLNDPFMTYGFYNSVSQFCLDYKCQKFEISNDKMNEFLEIVNNKFSIYLQHHIDEFSDVLLYPGSPMTFLDGYNKISSELNNYDYYFDSDCKINSG